jgi:hypothetical protein
MVFDSNELYHTYPRTDVGVLALALISPCFCESLSIVDGRCHKVTSLSTSRKDEPTAYRTPVATGATVHPVSDIHPH